MEFADDRTRWKGVQLGYDKLLVNPDDTRECLYCLTASQAKALLAVIDLYRYKTRWHYDGEVNRAVINDFTNDIQRRLMMACCGDEAPVQFRWTVNFILEMSSDGGATWNPAPQFDPRQYSPEFPPPAGEDAEDNRCVAATGMIVLMKEQIFDQITTDMTRYTLDQLISDWVNTLLETSNPFLALIQIVVNQIFALVLSVLVPQLATENWELLKCIFFCNMSGDVSFTAEQLDQVTTDVGEQYSGVTTLFLQQLINLLGEGGLTNLARAGGAVEGDCSECPCNDFWCWDGDFTTSSYSVFFSGLSVSGGQDYATVWTDGVGWQTTNGGVNYSILVWLMDDIPGLRFMKFEMTDNGDVTVDGRGDTLHGTFTENYQNPDLGLSWDGSATNPYHMYGKRSSAVISAFHAEGVGANPFGANNCEPSNL